MLEVTPVLYDQSSDIVTDNLSLRIINAKGGVLFDKSVQSNQKVIYYLRYYSVPGEWTIIAEKGDLEAKDTVTIEKFRNLEASIKDHIVYLTNKGNVDYEDRIYLKFYGKEKDFEITSKKKIKVNETRFINLNDELPNGQYDAEVQTKEWIKKLGPVAITDGRSKWRFTGIYIMLVLILLIILAYILITGREERKIFVKTKSRKALHKIHAPFKKLRRKRSEHITHKPAPKAKPTPLKKTKSHDLKASKEEIRDFRKQIMESIKKTEQKAEDVLTGKKGGKKGESGGMFNMFG
jgi:hypothetical protein